MATSSAVYVNAGAGLAQVASLSDLLSLKLLLSFTLLGIFPLFSRWVVAWYKNNRAYRGYSEPVSYDADLIVIGGGAGGLVTSIIAADAQAKVVLIEQDLSLIHISEPTRPY